MENSSKQFFNRYFFRQLLVAWASLFFGTLFFIFFAMTLYSFLGLDQNYSVLGASLLMIPLVISLHIYLSNHNYYLPRLFQYFSSITEPLYQLLEPVAYPILSRFSSYFKNANMVIASDTVSIELKKSERIIKRKLELEACKNHQIKSIPFNLSSTGTAEVETPRCKGASVQYLETKNGLRLFELQLSEPLPKKQPHKIELEYSLRDKHHDAKPIHKIEYTPNKIFRCRKVRYELRFDDGRLHQPQDIYVSLLKKNKKTVHPVKGEYLYYNPEKRIQVQYDNAAQKFVFWLNPHGYRTIILHWDDQMAE